MGAAASIFDIDERGSLHDKRRELIAKIAEGRVVITSLIERHTAMGRKIDDATAALGRLEQQLESLNTVIQLMDADSRAAAPQPHAAPTLELAPAIVRTAAPPLREAPPPRVREPFRPMAFAKCVAGGGHNYVASRSSPDYVTCTRCRHRKLS